MKAYGMALELVLVSDFCSISLFFSHPVSQAHSQVASALRGELAETFFKRCVGLQKLVFPYFFLSIFFLLCYAF